MTTPHLLSDVGTSILGASLVGIPAYYAKVPLVLAYVVAGVLLGPHLGLGLVKSAESISILSEIGLVLLMFILGLEINLRKLLHAGKAVVVTGILQFLGCVALALPFFWGLGYRGVYGSFDLLYLAVAASLSSTLVVVKMLSDRRELDSLTSRISLGILVFQDLWAMVFLALQPNLLHPEGLALLFSLGRALLLIVVTALVAKHLLPRLFLKIGKHVELMLVVAMAWCFGIAKAAEALGLSMEMGSLVAGVAIASFPYRLDLAAKISSLRDFFITLFFVALGLQLPVPTQEVLGLTLALIVFALGSRVLTIFPTLRFLRYGNRASLVPSLNLSQVSEFSLILLALGVSLGHVTQTVLSAATWALVATVLISSVLIPYAHATYLAVNPWLEKLGLKDTILHEPHRAGPAEPAEEDPKIVFLGFFREASSLLEEIHRRHSPSVLADILVVDFNPEAHVKLRPLGVRSAYADIAHPDTLRHLPLAKAQLLICTIPDHLLKGTNNLRLVALLKHLAPSAQVIVTAETIESARQMYEYGAAYVIVPRLILAHYVADALERIRSGQGESIRTGGIAFLSKWREILP